MVRNNSPIFTGVFLYVGSDTVVAVLPFVSFFEEFDMRYVCSAFCLAMVVTFCGYAGYEKVVNEIVPRVMASVESQREPLSNLWTVKQEPERPAIVRVAYSLNDGWNYVAVNTVNGYKYVTGGGK